jgi:hypothetical protein
MERVDSKITKRQEQKSRRLRNRQHLCGRAQGIAQYPCDQRREQHDYKYCEGSVEEGAESAAAARNPGDKKTAIHIQVVEARCERCSCKLGNTGRGHGYKVRFH